FASRAKANAPPGSPDPGPGVIRAFIKWILPFAALIALGITFHWTSIFTSPDARTPATPFDFLCFLVLLTILARGTMWIFRDGGAELVAERRLVNTFTSSDLEIKIWWVLFVAAGTGGWLFRLLVR